jgi:hypothetical protein
MGAPHSGGAVLVAAALQPGVPVVPVPGNAPDRRRPNPHEAI